MINLKGVGFSEKNSYFNKLFENTTDLKIF